MRTLTLVKATLAKRVQTEKAYVGNFWTELGSTTLYVITFIIFVDLLFQRTGPIAGFTENEFLFMTLLGQMAFYGISQLIINPMVYLIESVRSGAFDFTLLRPAPTKTFLYASAIKPVYALFVSVPNIAIFAFIIDWSQLNLSPLSVVGGVLVWVCGLLIFNTLAFLLAYPVFTQGDATDMLNVWYSLTSMTEIPYQVLPGVMKFLSFTILPPLLMAAGATQVMLSKGLSFPLVLLSLVAAGGALIVYDVVWRKALRNYTSASS